MSNFINDMILAAKDNNPTDFETAFKSEIQSRVADGINDRKADIVGSMLGVEFNTGTETPPPQE